MRGPVFQNNSMKTTDSMTPPEQFESRLQRGAATSNAPAIHYTTAADFDRFQVKRLAGATAISQDDADTNESPTVSSNTDFKIHDLTALTMQDAYAETQQGDRIKPGDLLVVEDGIAILDGPWPVMLIGKSKHFHHLNVESATWDDRAAQGVDYRQQVKFAQSKSKAELLLMAGLIKNESTKKLPALEVHPCDAMCINAPQFFRDPEFVEWLNSSVPKFTYHRRATPVDEWSDVVVMVDPSLSGEGADTDMPRGIWDQIVEVCKQRFEPTTKHHIMVRLTNLQV
jgi:hypothetical protein